MTLEKLTQSIKESLNSSNSNDIVFGKSIQQGTITIIPVSKFTAMGGFGGQNESEEGEKEQGFGMGVKFKNVPIGFIKVVDGDAEFIEIIDRSSIIKGYMVLGGIALFLLLRRMRRK